MIALSHEGKDWYIRQLHATFATALGTSFTQYQPFLCVTGNSTNRNVNEPCQRQASFSCHECVTVQESSQSEQQQTTQLSPLIHSLRFLYTHRVKDLSKVGHRHGWLSKQSWPVLIQTDGYYAKIKQLAETVTHTVVNPFISSDEREGKKKGNKYHQASSRKRQESKRRKRKGNHCRKKWNNGKTVQRRKLKPERATSHEPCMDPCTHQTRHLLPD